MSGVYNLNKELKILVERGWKVGLTSSVYNEQHEPEFRLYKKINLDKFINKEQGFAEFVTNFHLFAKQGYIISPDEKPQDYKIVFKKKAFGPGFSLMIELDGEATIDIILAPKQEIKKELLHIVSDVELIIKEIEQ